MSLVKREELDVEKLIDILTNAGLVASVDNDGDIYVKGLEFGLWLSLSQDEEVLRLYTWAQAKEGAPIDELPQLSEECNRGYRLVQFSSSIYEDGRGYLNGSYFMYINFGINAPQLIYTIRKFASIFVAALREQDADDKFFE